MVSLGRRQGSRAARATHLAEMHYLPPVEPEPEPAQPTVVVSVPESVDPEQSIPVVDSDHVAYWEVWGGPIGRTVKPALAELEANVPGLTSSIAFTPAGLAVCWVGVDESIARRVSALAGASFSLGGAAASRAVDIEEDSSHLDAMHLVFGNSHGVVIAITDLIVGPLLLWAAAEDVNLGVLTFQAKACATSIRKLLVREDGDTN